ncbi:hypothetical protein [Clostridium sp. DJ247]|uniref:hypothetical protein n=1 Tax=Clostridium sp. DJ247 TaxID=2726188 RepID=UPI0016290631|nr:hypothetical protein [Clostridium sp. DJ247]MBC2581434.1 hypothetical protein [Clostridium sp. DJ247]
MKHIKNNFIKASTIESGFWDFDGKLGCNTMYLITHVKDSFNLEILKESLKYIVKDIPILSCKMSKGYWRDKWERIENFDISQIIQTIRVDKDSFYDKAYSQFVQLVDKRIILENEPPLKVKIFYNEEIENKVIVFCIHHALADGRGSFQLVKLIGTYYYTLFNNNKLVPQKNYRKMSRLIFSFNMITIINMILLCLKGLFQPKLSDSFKPLLEMDNINNKGNGESIERIILSKENINKIKSFYKDFDFTINDIILLLTTKLMTKYNMILKEPSSCVGAALGIDLRRYLKEDILSITNYSVMEMFIVYNTETNDLPRMVEKLKSLKKRPFGIGLILQIFLSNIFPITVQKYIFNKWAKEFIIEGSVRMMQTTNVGKLDDYATPFGDVVENLSFVGPSPRYGFPEVSVSGYKDSLTIYFTKYNDENNLTKKVKNDFNELLNEILAQ